jgi:hypothetical protein
MVGNQSGYFNPKAAISRAEAAKIVSVINNPATRNPQKIDLSKVPYSIVNAPGYKDKIFVFTNWEMKKVFDMMKDAQKKYDGATSNMYGDLDFFGNEELKTKQFNKAYYFLNNISDRNTYFDFGMNFSENVYTLSLSLEDGRPERASKVVDLFLSNAFKNNAQSVKKLIYDNVDLAREGYGVNTRKIMENREVVIDWDYGSDYFYIGISAYPDKK